MSKLKKDNDIFLDLDNDPEYAKDGVPEVSISLDDLTVDTIDLGATNLGESFTIPDTLYIGDSDSEYNITFNDNITVNTVTTSTNRWDIYTSDNYQFPWNGDYKLWEHCLPSLSEVEEMCKEYPGLKKAYENFKTIYKMVEQDYKGKKEDDS